MELLSLSLRHTPKKKNLLTLSERSFLAYEMSITSFEFRQVEFSNIRRQGNKLAHLLVKFALSNYHFST